MKFVFITYLALFITRGILEYALKPRPLRPEASPVRAGLFSYLLLVESYLVSGLWVAFLLWKEPMIDFRLYVLGILMFVLGVVGRASAFQELGQNYSPYIVIASGGKLITTGIYSWIRHPLFSFQILEMLGFLCIKWSAVTIICLGLTALIIWRRIYTEEDLLEKTYGEIFLSYKKRTRSVIPFVL